MKKINLEGEFGWDINVNSIRPQLEAAKGEDLDVYLASPGGSVFKGIHVFNLFRDYKRQYPDSQNTLTVKGLAASMSSYLMMCPAFDMVVVEDNACFMMHNPYGGVMGDYRDANAFYKMIEGLTDMMSEAYMKKLCKPKKEIREMLDSEHWAFGADIVKQGFADEVLTTEEEKNPDNAYAMAKMQIKELNKKLREEEVKSEDMQEIAAMLAFEEISYTNDKFIEKLYEQAEPILHTSDVRMPYPNEHAARIRQPGDFEENSFRRKNIETGIDIIIGKLKGKTTTTTQAYRFKKDKFTVAEAKKWLKDHDVKYISFEPASGEKDSTNQEQDPATITRDNNIKEVLTMTLKEFLAQDPAAKKEYEDALQAKFDAGVKSVQDRIAGAMVYIKPDSIYPGPIRSLAVQVVQGEVSNDSLRAAVATYDALIEKDKSKDAQDESDKTKNATGQQLPALSEDGIIRSEADMQAIINGHKAQKGMEVN